MEARHENVTVVITTGRWTAFVKVTEQDGAEHEYVASADHGITFGDGIFFDTRAAYDEAERRAGY